MSERSGMTDIDALYAKPSKKLPRNGMDHISEYSYHKDTIATAEFDSGQFSNPVYSGHI